MKKIFTLILVAVATMVAVPASAQVQFGLKGGLNVTNMSLNDDILKTDIKDIISRAKEKDPEIESVRILGNLPYYITTPIIMKILREDVPADSITVMMQKEVAERIKSGPGKKTYGALSIAVQYYCTVEKVCEAPAGCFEPRPKVDSEVLKLDIRAGKAVNVKDEELFFECVKAGFSQRRKTMSNCIKSICGSDREKAVSILIAAGIDPARRAETLSIEEFAALADSVFEDRKQRIRRKQKR